MRLFRERLPEIIHGGERGEIMSGGEERSEIMYEVEECGLCGKE